MEVASGTMIGILGIILFFFFIGYSMTKGKGKAIKNNAITLGLAGACLVAAIWGFGFLPSGEETTTPTIIYQPPTTTTTDQYPSFDITPSAVTGGNYNSFTTLNSAETIFTVPAWANTTAHTIIQVDNSTAWADPRLQFTIIPTPYAGATADDLATIYFTVSNYDATVDIEDDVDQRLITKSSGKYQVIWSDGSSTWYVEGSKTMLMTDNATLTLDFDIDQSAMSYMDENDPISMTVTFHNYDWSWSETYTVNFVVQQSW